MSGATANIYGGIFNNNNINSPDSVKILWNSGTMNIKNLDSYTFMIGLNDGTLNIDESYFHNFQAAGLVSTSGSLNISNTTINFYTTDFSSGFVGNTRFMLIANAVLDNVNLTGNLYSGEPVELIFTSGTVEIKNSSINLGSSTSVLNNSGNLTIKNTPTYVDKPISNSGKLIIDNSAVSSAGTAISSSGTLELINGSSITSPANVIHTSGTVNVANGTSIVSTNGIGINMVDNSIVNLGEIGNVPDQTTPYIEGTTYGIYKGTSTSKLNFYDGLIVGKTGPNAIYGGVTSVEGGYETENITETNPEDPNDITYKEYLTVSGNSVAIAKVGNYTFTTNLHLMHLMHYKMQLTLQ